MADRLIVTLDGPAGVGKTTLAKRTADALGVAYLDTGAMFRATAWKLGEGAWEKAPEDIARELESMEFTLSGTGANSVLSLNGAPLTEDIRTETVGMWASNIAALPVVRAFQKTAQQAIGTRTSLVAEGRDMGTVVFPEAPCKFFLDAAPEERGRRRFLQLKEMGRPADLEEITEAVRIRDHQDRNRTEAPLKPAENAVIVDTTELDIDRTFERIMQAIRDRH